MSEVAEPQDEDLLVQDEMSPEAESDAEETAEDEEDDDAYEEDEDAED